MKSNLIVPANIGGILIGLSFYLNFYVLKMNPALQRGLDLRGAFICLIVGGLCSLVAGVLIGTSFSEDAKFIGWISGILIFFPWFGVFGHVCLVLYRAIN